MILAEFGNERHPSYPDVDSDPATAGPTTFEGPLHNEIPEPDRAVDNRTVWQPDYNQEHFQTLYFGKGEGVESLKTYYETQSSGRYTVDGEVTDWVKVHYNEARYGRNCCVETASAPTEHLGAGHATPPTSGSPTRRPPGRTDAQIKADLTTLRPVGPLRLRRRRQLQRVRRLHRPLPDRPRRRRRRPTVTRSRARTPSGPPLVRVRHRPGRTGPADNQRGGTQIGDTGIWIGDYTIQPENGGLSVFAHEYGHDLGLPDDYDTTGGATTTTSSGR